MKKGAAAGKSVKLRVADKEAKGEQKKESGKKGVSKKARAWAKGARKDEKEGRTSKWPD